MKPEAVRDRFSGRAPRAAWTILLALLWSFTGGLPQAVFAGADYRQIEGACNQEFPRDHGPHEGFKTEWWYYTGNLDEAGGHRFGFQLTFFRRQLAAEAPRPEPPGPPSPWRANQIILAHAALTDLTQGTFHQHERISRAAADLAGALLDGDEVRVFLADWQLNLGPRLHRLRARTADFTLELDLVPEKPPVLHGSNGASRKGQRPESASCYYSFTRLAASGRVSRDGRQWSVTGQAWMDHEYSSAPLEPDLLGWDWFSLQLSDQSEIMIYLLRDRQGRFTAASAGTLVDAAGQVSPISGEDIALAILEHWTSPRTGGRYPARWRLGLAGTGIELEIKPNQADQEMLNQESGLPPYWEGSVNATGSRHGRPLTGRGYVELTGYARAFDAPL